MKLEFKSNSKPESNSEERPANNDEKEASSPQKTCDPTTPIMLEEGATGTPTQTSITFVAPRRTMDWLMLKRIAICQMTLAFVAMLCIVVVVFGSNLNRILLWYKTAMFVWVIYLAMTAYWGYKSNARNYCGIVAYFVMSLFQTMINGFWLAGVFMAVCYTVILRERGLMDNGQSSWIRTGMIAVELLETSAVLGSVFTGLLGVVGCCQGFGRMLQYTDQAIMAQNGDSKRF